MIKHEQMGNISVLVQGKRALGVLKPLMWVRSYSVDGVLIDTGLNARRRDVLAFCQQHKVRRAIVTHHHEDHSGNGGALQAEGIEVAASARTCAIVEKGFALKPYQHLAWGAAPRFKPSVLPATVETPNHVFQRLEAPGHCDDQVVFYEKERGWLFSGDAFLAEGIKYFRADENFSKTVASLSALVKLDFDDLYCAHRPVLGDGRAALARKLQRLQDLEGEVRRRYAQGRDARQITHELFGTSWGMMPIMTLGDASSLNLVRAVLFGPRPRSR